MIGWLADDLTEEEHAELVDAANEGNAMGFIMLPIRGSSPVSYTHLTLPTSDLV